MSAPESHLVSSPADTPVHARPSHLRDESLRRTVEAELLPRLVLAHRTPPVPPQLSAAVGRLLDEAEIEEFVRRVRGIQEPSLDSYIGALLEAGVTPESIYLDLMAPAARRLGELWTDDECSFVEVSLAVGRMQRVLRLLEGRFHSSPHDAGGDERRVLLTGLTGEQHTLGLILVAEFFLRDGWMVDVGTPFGGDDPIGRLDHEWYDVVGFSVSSSDRLDELRTEILRVRTLSRNPSVRVLVGGPAFVQDPGLARAVGADGTASDARAATRVAVPPKAV